MSKHLNKYEWMRIRQIFKNEGLSCAVKHYSKIQNKVYIGHSLSGLKKRILKKVFLIDNLGMEILTRKPGSGRPKKRDDSDIPAIIDELNMEVEKLQLL